VELVRASDGEQGWRARLAGGAAELWNKLAVNGMAGKPTGDLHASIGWERRGFPHSHSIAGALRGNEAKRTFRPRSRLLTAAVHPA
jgi:hypothetical protein